ncbi:MAG TPA: YCF48-related protein [Bryobacteraceae bacterium]|jgi:hypothetical protein
MRFGAVRWLRLAAVAAALAAPLAAQRWETKYLYDQDKTGLVFTDLAFPSAQRGVAVGFITDGNHDAPVSLVTSDSGEHWQRLPLAEMPVSLFFLNEDLGWLVTTKGLWRTTEAGKNWVKLPKPPAEILHVSFLDESNGWAVGARKSILETHDGARHWKPVAAAAEPPGDPKYSAYTWIAFANPETALVTGWNIPERRWGDEEPDWMDPSSALLRSDLPHLNYTLTTHDGGKTWSSRAASLFGELERVRLLPDGRGLGLTVYSQGFRYPSEVYRLNWHTGKNVSIYKTPDFAVSDIWLAADGTAYLAGTLVQGKLRDVVPGKVRVLASKDYVEWKEVPVDYRAEAHRVILAAVDEGNMWIATDMGMILKLVPAR